ncbi:GntR family transcriptional regulator [Roseomonas elaeocarpi]|uniref:GntR family transcriptional regulator n=1 Tax=Roseomonas elaeocarpi TaxID=907779 RepID=A0ABV6JPG8_9PROT
MVAEAGGAVMGGTAPEDPWRPIPPEEGGSAPLYLALAGRVAAAVERGVLRPGEALPPERVLATRTGLSRTTVRKAVEELASRGLVASRHGSGTFVAARINQPLARLSSFSEDMAARGAEPGQTWVEQVIRLPSAEEVVALALPAGRRVASFVRIRRADGEPLAVERAVVPADCIPDPALVTGSLYAVLEARGHAPARALQLLRAAAATAADARLLGIAPGSPVMCTVRHGYREDGSAVEFTRSTYRGDRYDFVAEMRRIPSPP